MRKMLVIAAAAALGGLAAVPASAAAPAKCNAVLLGGALLASTDYVTSSHGVLGYTEGDENVTVTAKSPLEISDSLYVTAKDDDGINFTWWRDGRATSREGAWISPRALNQTKGLEKCLIRRF